MRHFILCIINTLLFSAIMHAQCPPADITALEDIIFEVYYISDANDATDQDGGTLPEGSVTWRIFADLKPAYSLLGVFGNPTNLLSISTTTFFFNNADRGETVGSSLPANRLNDNTVALDSYITIGAASNQHWGVPKADDPNGSSIGGPENDGGSAGIAEGLLANEDPLMGLPLTQADGLFQSTVPATTSVPGLGTFSMFGNENSSTTLNVTNAAWSVLGGAVSPLPENKILLAQITSNGIVSGCINFQVGIPAELQGSLSNCKTNIRYFANLTQADIDAAAANSTQDRWAAATHPKLCFTLDPDNINTDARNLSKLPFKLYPNPAKESFFIYPENLTGNLSYAVYDAFGRMVKQNGTIPADGRPIEINIAHLPSGLYFVQLTANGMSATRKVVKY